MSQIDPPECMLRLAAEGTAERCPRERCSFWEPGGAVFQGGCLIERLGVDVRRHLNEFPDYYTRLDRMETEANQAGGRGE